MPITSKFISLKEYIPAGNPKLSHFLINASEINEKIYSFKKKIKKNIYKISVIQNKGLVTIKKLLINNVYK